MVGDEIKVVVRGQIMGLKKRIIHMFTHKLEVFEGHTRTLLSGCFVGGYWGLFKIFYL